MLRLKVCIPLCLTKLIFKISTILKTHSFLEIVVLKQLLVFVRIATALMCVVQVNGLHAGISIHSKAVV